MKPDDRLQFDIKLNQKIWHCEIIPNEGNYILLLDNQETASIQLNKSEKWVQLNGRKLPAEFIDEVGSHIEASYREELFEGN